MLAWMASLVVAAATAVVSAAAPAGPFFLNHRDIVCEATTDDHHRSLRFQLTPLRPDHLGAALGEFAVLGVLQSIPGHPVDFYFYAFEDRRDEAAAAVAVELADRRPDPGTVLAEAAVAHPATGDVLTATCMVVRPGDI